MVNNQNQPCCYKECRRRLHSRSRPPIPPILLSTTTPPPKKLPNLAYFGLTTVNDKIYVVGGTNNLVLDSPKGYVYDPELNIWNSIADMPAVSGGDPSSDPYQGGRIGLWPCFYWAEYNIRCGRRR